MTFPRPRSSTRGIIPAVIAGSLLLACQPRAAEKAAEEVEPHTAEAHRALVGRRAPAVVVEGIDGERVALADLIGRKPVYLKFWATWCKPCVKQMPHLEAAHRKYGDRIATYAIALGLNDPIETVRAFRAQHKLTVPVAIDRDGSLAERLHVAVTPQHVLIDRHGVVRYVGHGTTAALDAALEALLGDAAAPGDAPPPVAPAADQPLSLTLLGGEVFSLAEQAGRPVALTFVSTSFDHYLAVSRPAMSEACIAHARKVESLRPSHEQVSWVTIVHPVWTDEAELDEYRKRLGHGSPIAIDRQGTWFHRFRVRDVPTTILLDERGVEIARVSGRGDDLPAALSRLR